MSEQVELPWLDDPVELSEAVELIARAGESDEETIQEITDRIETLERRVGTLEDSNSVVCPSCGNEKDVYKAGVGAAKLAASDSLSDNNAKALNSASHLCLECRETFTPEVG